MVSTSVYRAVIMVTIATGAGRLLGFVREVFLASYFGTGWENDAFNLALNMPDMILCVVTVALTTTFIPLYSQVCEQSGPHEAIRFTNSIMFMVAGCTALLSLTGYGGARVLIGLAGAGFSDGTQVLAARLLQIMAPTIFFTGVVSVLSGYLQSNRQYFGAALIGVPLNILIIICLVLLTPRVGITAPAWGYQLGTGFQAIMLWVVAWKMGCHFIKPDFSITPYLKKMAFLALPVIVSSSVLQVNVLVSSILASGLQEGAVSSLHYAERLMLFPHNVVMMSLAAVAFPVLSKAAAGGGLSAVRGKLAGWVEALLLLSLPLAFLLYVLSQPVVEFVFQHGRFDSTSTLFTSQALEFYALGLPAYGLREIFNRAFYSVQDSLTPMYNGVVAMALNIALSCVLVRLLGHCGLALASTLAGIAAGILLILQCRRKQLLWMERCALFRIIGYLTAALAAASLARIFRTSLPVIICGFGGLAVYAILLLAAYIWCKQRKTGTPALDILRAKWLEFQEHKGGWV